MDVAVWLRSLGLERYEAAFRENDIDETVLPGLTQDPEGAWRRLDWASCEAAGYHRFPARRRERQDAIR